MWTCWGHQSFEVNLVSWTNWKGLKFGFPAKRLAQLFWSDDEEKQTVNSRNFSLLGVGAPQKDEEWSRVGIWCYGAQIDCHWDLSEHQSILLKFEAMWSFGCPSVDCFINKLARHSTTNAVSPTQRYHYGCSRGKLQQCTLTQTSNLNNAFFVLKIKCRLRV